jgi:hypothetical protein
MYRDDDIARSERANALIDEIAKLERQKVEQAATDQRLEAARTELRAMQSNAPVASERSPSFVVHVGVFALTASVAFLAYVLLV